MSTQQIIESWENGREPYNATTKRKFPKPLSTNPWGDPKVSALARKYEQSNRNRLGLPQFPTA